MRAVVTGAAGFIGRAFTRRLVDDGWRVAQIDTALPSTFAMDCRDWFHADSTHYELAIHCAAVIHGRAGIDGAPLAVAENLELDAAFARWCLRTRPARVVYFSSSAAYPVWMQGPSDHHRLREEDIDLDAIRQPDAVYGLAKLVGETLMRHLERAGIRVHVFRPFSGYGTDQALDYPFPTFIARAAVREDPFTVWGDGSQVRDWIHVDDIVEAVLAAIEADVVGPLNLGSGIPVSFDELADLVCSAAGYRPAIRHVPAAPTGVRYRVCNPRRMLEVHRPTVSLGKGIHRALDARGIAVRT